MCLWTEERVPGTVHKENMQRTGSSWPVGLNSGPSYCEVTVVTTTQLCHPLESDAFILTNYSMEVHLSILITYPIWGHKEAKISIGTNTIQIHNTT